MSASIQERTFLARWAWVSVAAAVITLVLKFGAYALTDSVGLLSDAVESSVNLVAAFTALFALLYATRPVDRSHNFGHEKIEFFASAVEGGLILFAAGAIGWYSVHRFLNPQPLQDLSLGLFVSLIATAVNLFAARILLRVAREHDSIVLDADGHHLMTDVWTSIGVVVGLVLVRITGIERLDPILGLLVVVNILWTAFRILRTSFDGLMDRAIPIEDENAIRAAIEQELVPGVTYHALRTRRAGSRRIVDLHLLVPGKERVRDAHDAANHIELAIDRVYPGTETTVHIEPVEDPDSWTDSDLIALESPPAVLDLPDFLQSDPVTRSVVAI